MSQRIVVLPYALATTRPITAAPAASEASRNVVAQPAADTDELTEPGRISRQERGNDPESLIAARLIAAPVTTLSLSLLSGLQRRRVELTAQLEEQAQELEAWRKEHGGFDSVARLAMGVGQLVKNVIACEPNLLDGVGEKVTDAETLEKAPQRARIEELKRALAEVDAAQSTVCAGRKIVLHPGSDFVVREMAQLQQRGAETPSVELFDSRARVMREHGEAKNAPAAYDAYLGAAQLYLGLPGTNGESLARGRDGSPSVLSKVNALISADALGEKGKLALSAVELEKVMPEITKLRESKHASLAQALTDEVLRAELERLRAWERAPQTRGLLAKAETLQKDFDTATAGDGLWKSMGRGVLDILDSPETYAMVATGRLVSGVGRRLLAVPFAAAKAGSQTVALHVGALAVDGALFHTAMNGFNLARLKPDRATWGADDYAKSILLFEALGGLSAYRSARGLTHAVEGWRRPLRAVRFFTEEAAVLSLLGIAEAAVRSGDLRHAREILLENFQFLVALRLLGGGQKLFSRKKNAADQDVSALQQRFLRADRKFIVEPTPENIRGSIDAFAEYARAHVRANAAAMRSLLPPVDARSLRPLSKAIPPDLHPVYEQLAKALTAVYEKYPSLQINTDPALIAPAAREVLGDVRGEWVAQAMQKSVVFEPARKRAMARLAKRAPVREPKSAVVSGAGPSGLLAAIALARSGYTVRVVELRNEWTRRNQLIARQALADELATLDPALSQKLMSQVAERVTYYGGSRLLGEEGTAVPLPVDALRTPRGVDGAFQSVSHLRVEAKKLEKLLVEHITSLNAAAEKAGRAAPVTFEKGATIALGPKDAEGRHPVSLQRLKEENGKRVSDGAPVEMGKPDLVLISEGARSESRAGLGIQSVNTSPDAKFVMGVFQTKNWVGHGLEVRRDENAAAFVQAFGDAGKSLLVASKLPPSGAGRGENQRAFEVEQLTRTASQLTGLAREKLSLEWHEPAFSVQQHLSSGARSGDNVILMGDAVGNSSFLTGGGMMTAAVPHLEALKRLLHKLEKPGDRNAALERYEDDATAASILWGERGIREYFPDSRFDYETPYREAIASWKRGEYPDPLTALEKELSKQLAPEKAEGPALGFTTNEA